MKTNSTLKLAIYLLAAVLNAVLVVWTVRTLFLVDLDYSLETLGAAGYLTFFCFMAARSGSGGES